jgi:hypothetical protein
MLLRERNRYGNMALWYIAWYGFSMNEGAVPNLTVLWWYDKIVYIRLPRWRFVWLWGKWPKIERACWPGWKAYRVGQREGSA